MTYRVNGENIVVQASCLGLVYLIITGTAVFVLDLHQEAESYFTQEKLDEA